MKTVLSALTLAALLAAAPASAEFGINVGAITVAPNDSSSNLNVVEQVAGLPAGSTAVGVSSNTQLGLTLDYKFTPNWSVQLIAATPFSHDINVKGSAIDGLKVGSTKHLPPTLLAQYHFMPQHQTFDPFIGVGLNYTVFFDEQIDGELEGAQQRRPARQVPLDGRDEQVDLRHQALHMNIQAVRFSRPFRDGQGLGAQRLPTRHQMPKLRARLLIPRYGQGA